MTPAREPVLINGREFILSQPDHVPAVWGSDTHPIWSMGETFMIAGPPGVGKSTVIQLVTLGLLGLRTQSVLGYMVTPTLGGVLYLALDRPPQIARSMNRMVRTESEHNLRPLDDLHMCTDPGCSILAEPERVAELALRLGCTSVIVDSLYSTGANLRSDDDVARLNTAWGLCEAQGITVALVHHTRKPSRESDSTETRLAAIYGSVFLTAAVGSVLLMDPDAKGDRDRARLHHVKSPAEPVGPLDLVFDHSNGEVSSTEPMSISVFLTQNYPTAVSTSEVALAVYGNTNPATKNKTRAKLKALRAAGKVKSSVGERKSDRWILTSAPEATSFSEMHSSMRSDPVHTQAHTEGSLIDKPSSDRSSDRTSDRTRPNAVAVDSGPHAPPKGGRGDADETPLPDPGDNDAVIREIARKPGEGWEEWSDRLDATDKAMRNPRPGTCRNGP